MVVVLWICLNAVAAVNDVDVVDTVDVDVVMLLLMVGQLSPMMPEAHHNTILGSSK